MDAHFVPEFYLKGFTDPDTPAGHKPYLWIYKIDERRWRKRAPKNVATEPDYYTFMDRDGNRQDNVEGFLADLEGRTATVIRDSILRLLCSSTKIAPPSPRSSR
jgi:hypothetical protein